MKEFGSDFHFCDYTLKNSSCFSDSNACYYSSGRHALEAIICQEKWKRIWIPSYFCYEVIGHLSSLGIEIKLYSDNPLVYCEDDIIRSLPFNNGDVLLRMNYFGLRTIRSNEELPVPVIEDHTHDIISDWALNSNADWCIASIRKTLPVAAGGILWSPLKKKLPQQLKSTNNCEQMAEIRYDAMQMKKKYFKEGGDKDIFRNKYILSEEMIEKLSISGMDKKSFEIFNSIDVDEWTSKRKTNWITAYNILSDKFNILKPYNIDNFNPFSLIFICNSMEDRGNLRSYLIQRSIFPAILWKIPENTTFDSTLDFSNKMLSVHCDARYTKSDIERMCKTITEYYD